MSPDSHSAGIATLTATTRAINDAQVDRAIEALWIEFRSSASLQSEARQGGVDVDALLKSSVSPLRASRIEGQYDVSTLIMIATAGGLATQAIAGFWKVLVWPYLERKFGAGLELKKDE